MALGHVGYVPWTYGSFIGLKLLTAKLGMDKPSGAIDIFKNASVGEDIKRYHRMSTHMIIGALTTSDLAAAG